jgi:FdrA protein
MGPDCGTAILNGVGLGFANRMQPGPVGIVGASGTGIQQICALLDQANVGIAHAIGTGGRDLSAAVGASMTRRALWMLEGDERVEVIAVISKPADSGVARRLHQELMALHKPVVACLLGETLEDGGTVRYVETLTQVAQVILEQQGRKPASILGELARAEAMGANTPRGRVYGLFAGGTLCSEAGRVLDDLEVGHDLVDLGADEYTRGRAHPIIDPRLRASLLAGLKDHDDLGVVLLDVVLGDLAHPNPAGSLLPPITELRRTQPDVPVVATLVGTRADPQGLKKQWTALEKAGVSVFISNVAAALAAGCIASGRA